MTREEAIKRLKETRSTIQPFGYVDEALDVAIKALEQEPILDKIRAEIEAHPKTYPFVNHINAYIKASECLQIIDKYKAESEE